MELLHRRPQQARAGIVHPAELAHLGRSHVGIGHQPCIPKALPLPLPRSRSFRSASTRAWMAPVLKEQDQGLAHPLVRQLFTRLAKPASTQDTSMWMSTDRRPARSSSGPEMRFW
jgi:hypothetical protein